MILYHYPQCPFCRRIRLFLGFKNIPYESIPCERGDKKIFEKFKNFKTLPIMEFNNGIILNESLDILREIEQQNPFPIGFIGPIEQVFQWTSTAVSEIPKYFEVLKTQNTDIFETNILPHFEPIIEKVEDQYFIMGPTFSVADCVLAADLSRLISIPNVNIPSEIKQYVERVEKHCKTNLKDETTPTS